MYDNSKDEVNWGWNKIEIKGYVYTKTFISTHVRFSYKPFDKRFKVKKGNTSFRNYLIKLPCRNDKQISYG